MAASSFLNAFIAWLRDKYHRTEEGRHQWQAYWAGITTPPPGRRARPAAAPTAGDEDLYGG